VYAVLADRFVNVYDVPVVVCAPPEEEGTVSSRYEYALVPGVHEREMLEGVDPVCLMAETGPAGGADAYRILVDATPYLDFAVSVNETCGDCSDPAATANMIPNDPELATETPIGKVVYDQSIPPVYGDVCLTVNDTPVDVAITYGDALTSTGVVPIPV